MPLLTSILFLYGMAPRKQGRTAPAGACGDARAVRAQFGNGTLRLTTRQTYQLHGVLKQDLKSVFSSVIKNMGSTLGACGDVNRNVLAPPVRPWRPARRPGNGDHGVTEVGHGAAGHFEPGAVPVKACSIVAALTTSLLAVLRHGMRRKGLIGKPMDVVDISVRARAQAPFTDRPEYSECERLAEQLADLLAPQSGAYYDVWLDGEKFVSSQIEVSWRRWARARAGGPQRNGLCGALAAQGGC